MDIHPGKRWREDDGAPRMGHIWVHVAQLGVSSAVIATAFPAVVWRPPLPPWNCLLHVGCCCLLGRDPAMVLPSQLLLLLPGVEREHHLLARQSTKRGSAGM